MKHLLMITALLFAGLTWSCGGGENKTEGTDSTKTEGTAEKKETAPVECPKELEELKAAHVELRGMIMTLNTGTAITKESEEAVKSRISDLKMTLTSQTLSEDCQKKFESIEIAKAYADLAEAHAKSGK